MITKISFAEAATTLEHLCDQIDNADVIADNIQTIFKQSTDDLSAAVNRRISYLKYAESQLEGAKKMRDTWNARATKFVKVIERIKADTMATMKANPNLPYKGTLGVFSIRKNSQPSLIIDNETFVRCCADFIQVKEEIDKVSLKVALLNGQEITGVRLEYGEHLRIGVK